MCFMNILLKWTFSSNAYDSKLIGKNISVVYDNLGI